MVTAEWVVRNAVSLIVTPPGSLLFLGVFGLALSGRRPRTGKAILALCLVSLYGLSTPYLSGELLHALEPPAQDPAANRRGDAIVILGSGQYYSAPEYAGDTVRAATLVRLRYGARLQRSLGKPVLVTGGSPEGSATAEAWLMKGVLQQEFAVPVTWVEEQSATTLESARRSHAILASARATTVYLVTHAWHMRRARLAFEQAGFTVIPAPTGFATRYRLTVLDFLPQAGALLDSAIFFHEVLGTAWYRLKFRLSG